MKKSKLFLCLFAGLLFFLSHLPNATAMTSDQKCSLAPTDSDLISSETTPREQSFTPAQNRLEMVHIMVDGPGFAGDQAVKLSILDSSHISIGSSTFTPSFPSGPDLRTAEFEPALVITPGQTYYIQVDVLEGANNLFWYRSPGDCYAGGTAYGEGFPYPWDFLFETLGNTYTPPAAQQSAPESTPSSTTPAGSSASSTGTAPSAVTDSKIKPPTDLIVENVNNETKPAVKLTWAKSATADITGYKVFRSLEEKNNFQEVGSIPLDKTEYTDSAVNAGTKYYYFVRAYKNSAQSVSTATLSVTTSTAATTTAVGGDASTDLNTNSAVETTTEGNKPNWPIIITSALLVLLIALFIYLEIRAKKKNEKISAKIFWPIVGSMVIVLGVLVWQIFFQDKKDEPTAASNTASTATAPKHADWQKYTSGKYGFYLYYPTDYTLTEGNTGTIKLVKGTTEMLDLYVYAANGDSAGMMKSQAALFTDNTKGYLTDGIESSVTVAGETAKQYSGIFGKNAGISQTHEGVKGSSVVFTKNDKLFVIDSYDNGDVAAQTIFNDILVGVNF